MPVTFNSRVCLPLAFALLTLFAFNPVWAAGMIDTANKKKELTVGVALFEPWVMRDQKGNLFGYDIDVARQLAKDLNVSVQFRTLEIDQLIDELQNEHVDIIISGMTITTPRNLRANFTIPYSNSGIQLLANQSAVKAGFSELPDFNDDAVRQAVVRSTLAESIAKELFPLAQLSEFNNETAALKAVKDGKVIAMLAATPFPEQQMARHPEIFSMPFPRKLRRTSEGFVIRKQDPDSLNVLNNWILQRIEDGWLPDRHDYWFTTTEWRSRL